MVDGQSGIPRGSGEATSRIEAWPLVWRQQWAAFAGQLLEKWAAQGQTGRVSKAAEHWETRNQAWAGTSCLLGGRLFHFVAKIQ